MIRTTVYYSLDPTVKSSRSGGEGERSQARNGRHGVRDRVEVVVLQREVLQRLQVVERLLVDVLYRVVQLDFTQEIDVFCMLFDRSLSFLLRHLSHS